MQNKKILFVITKSEVGGAQKWVKEQVDILNNHSYKCFICTNQKGWLTDNSLSIKNLIDKRIEKRISLGFFRKLNSFVDKHDINLLVGNSANGGLYARLSAFFTSSKSIYVTHGWSSVYKGGSLAFVYNGIEKFLSGITSKILCISKNDYQIAKQTIGIAPKRLKLIPNKIFPLQPDTACQLKNAQPRIANVLFLGRLAPPKMPVSLIKAIENNNSYKLDIVGTGPEIDSIEQMIRENNIQNVNVLGEIKGFNAFTNYDIFCLISKSEGLPISGIEALSCGLPILISDVGGCSEIIKDNGYLTDNSSADILKGIQFIQNNSKRFSVNSKKLFLEKFDLSTKYREYLDLYEEVLK